MPAYFIFPVAIIVSMMAMSSGIGGGIFFVPLIIFIFDVSPSHAVGTALLIELFGMSSGTFRYIKMGKIEWKAALGIIPVSIPAIILGSQFIIKIEEEGILLVLFGLFSCFLCGLMLYSIQIQDFGTREKIGFKETLPFLPVSFIAGICTGLFSIGSGEMNVVLLERFLKVKLDRAIATGVFVLASTVFLGASLNISGGNIIWPLAWFAIPGVIIGGQIGPFCAARVTERTLKRLFSYMVMGVAMFLCYQGILHYI